MKRHLMFIAALLFLACSSAGTPGGLSWAAPPPPGAAGPKFSFDAQTRLLGPIDLAIIEELKREHKPEDPPDLLFNGSDSGDAQPQVDPEIILEYYSRVSDVVTANWVAPEITLPADLTCTVEIPVAADGLAPGSKIRKSSGNADFDQSVMLAIEKSAPFPSLPPEFKGQTVEVWIKFYSEELLRLQQQREKGRSGGLGED